MYHIIKETLETRRALLESTLSLTKDLSYEQKEGVLKTDAQFNKAIMTAVDQCMKYERMDALNAMRHGSC